MMPASPGVLTFLHWSIVITFVYSGLLACYAIGMGILAIIEAGFRRNQDHAEVSVIRDPDVRAATHGPCRPDLAALVTRDGDDEGSTSHPVLSERGFVDQPSRHHGAVHAQQVVDGEPQGPVGRLAHLRGHVVPPRTLRRVYTGAWIDLRPEAGTTAAGRGVRANRRRRGVGLPRLGQGRVTDHSPCPSTREARQSVNL